MAYLPNYEWDIFISYAHADNDSDWPSPKWITRFYERLVPAIQKNLKGNLKVFFDQREQRLYKTIESILTEVEKSAIFLIVGSSNWVRSEDWCQEELRTFLRRRVDKTRIFVAEFEPPEGEFRFPDILPNNLRLKFWKKSDEYGLPMPLKPDESVFEERFLKLVHDTRERMMQLKTAERGRAPTAKHTVFLAYSTDDVEEEREELRDYLVGFDIDVLPDGEMPSNPEELRSVVREGLGRATIFVQLLGRRKSRPVVAGDESPTFIQSDEAGRRAHIATFRWRPDDVDPEKVDPEKNVDHVYKKLLRGAQNGTVNELGQTIRRTLDEQLKAVEKPPVPADVLNIVVNVDPEDMDCARELVGACKDKNCEVILDYLANDEMARSQWADAAAVAFVQGRVSTAWLFARYNMFKQARKMSGPAAALKGQAVVFAPPPLNKVKGTIVAPRLKEIDLSENWNVEPFTEWIDSLSEPDLPKPQAPQEVEDGERPDAD